MMLPACIHRVAPGLLAAVFLTLVSCAADNHQVLVTIADARSGPAEVVDIGEPGDSVGDMVVFDQPLLNEQQEVIGNNSGVCVRTRVGKSYQCQWTLTLSNGTIQVAGREADQGVSTISIVGGSGDYARITGEMVSVNNNDGTFTQTLRFYFK